MSLGSRGLFVPHHLPSSLLCSRRLTLPSSGPAYGRPLKSNVSRQSMFHAFASLHFCSVRHSIVAVSEGIAIRRQHRWRDRVSTYLCCAGVSRFSGLLATAMNPTLPFDTSLVASVVSSRLWESTSLRGQRPSALARRASSANHSFKRTGLRPAA